MAVMGASAQGRRAVQYVTVSVIGGPISADASESNSVAESQLSRCVALRSVYGER